MASAAGLALVWVVLGTGMALGLYDAPFATLAGIYGREVRRAITGTTLVAGFASTVGWPVTAFSCGRRRLARRLHRLGGAAAVRPALDRDRPRAALLLPGALSLAASGGLPPCAQPRTP